MGGAFRSATFTAPSKLITIFEGESERCSEPIGDALLPLGDTVNLASSDATAVSQSEVGAGSDELFRSARKSESRISAAKGRPANTPTKHASTPASTSAPASAA